MNWLEALILGLLQGLTEFLPVSSSGHLELGKVLLNTNIEDDIAFTVLVHAATMLSIILVFYKDLLNLIRHFFRFKWDEEMKFAVKILISMAPVMIVGLLWEDEIEIFFGGQILFVGGMLLVTATVLFLTNYSQEKKGQEVNFWQAFIIGMAQTIAILPGISRSGATIGTALLLGVDKSKATRFSFLMVLLPILGATLIKIKDIGDQGISGNTELFPMVVGFIAAFVSGYAACKWMLSIVRKGKLVYFAFYCMLIGLITIATVIFS